MFPMKLKTLQSINMFIDFVLVAPNYVGSFSSSITTAIQRPFAIWAPLSVETSIVKLHFNCVGNSLKNPQMNKSRAFQVVHSNGWLTNDSESCVRNNMQSRIKWVRIVFVATCDKCKIALLCVTSQCAVCRMHVIRFIVRRWLYCGADKRTQKALQ